MLKICWDIVNRSRNVNNNDNDGQTVTMTDNKTVLQALALINDCNKYKMDLTTNGVVITDAIKYVNSKEDIKTKGDCCFNHITGLPRKDGIEKSIFDYEKLLYDSLLIPEFYINSVFLSYLNPFCF